MKRNPMKCVRFLPAIFPTQDSYLECMTISKDNLDCKGPIQQIGTVPEQRVHKRRNLNS